MISGRELLQVSLSSPRLAAVRPPEPWRGGRDLLGLEPRIDAARTRRPASARPQAPATLASPPRFAGAWRPAASGRKRSGLEGLRPGRAAPPNDSLPCRCV